MLCCAVTGARLTHAVKSVSLFQGANTCLVVCGYRCQTPEWARIVPAKESDATCETKLLAYPYHVNKQPRCGDELTLATAAGPVRPTAGTWHTLTSHIRMNSAGAPLPSRSPHSTRTPCMNSAGAPLPPQHTMLTRHIQGVSTWWPI